MATSDYRFDAAQFREAIKFAMTMGAPPAPGDRAIFVFGSTGQTYWKNGIQLLITPMLDQDGRPLDPTVEVRKTQAVTKKQGPAADEIDCAIEFEPVDREELPVGNLRPGKMTVTVLDADYTKIQGCKEVQMTGDRYLFQYEVPALGLFDVGIRQLVFYALDES